MKLIDISEVYTGIIPSRKQAMSSEGSIKYKILTLRSFESDGWLNTDGIELYFSKEELNSKYLTRIGDIIIRLTAPYTSICISQDQVGIVVPSNFAIIRLFKTSFIPEYISIFLNSEMTKKSFFQFSISTTIPIISTSYIKQVDIMEKPLNIQEILIELNYLRIREKTLLLCLIKEKEKLAKAIIDKSIMEEI
jgi:restriction endonuclease S subunit